MNVWRELGELRREIEDLIKEEVGKVARWTKTTAASSDGQTDAVENYSDASDGFTQDQARRVAPWGIAGVPVVGLAGAVVRSFGEAAQSILVGIGHPSHARSGLATGETQLYNKVSGCEVYLDQNGSILVAFPAGQTLRLGSATATQPFIRGTDAQGALNTIVGAALVSLEAVVTWAQAAQANFPAIDPTGAATATLNTAVNTTLQTAVTTFATQFAAALSTRIEGE